MRKASTILKASCSALLAMLLTSLFQVMKSIWLPGLTAWQSHFVTIVFVSLAAALVAVLVLHWQQRERATIGKERANFETVIDHLPGFTCIVNPRQKQFVRWNTRLQKLLGYSDAELASIDSTQTLADEFRQELPARMGRVFEAGQVETEAAWLTKSGQKIPCYMTGVPVIIDGEPCVLSMGIDISERRQAEEALRKSEEQYRRLLANLPDVTWTVDGTGRITYISRNIEEVLGYSPEDVLGGELGLRLARIHPDDIEAATRSYQALFNENRIFDVEYRARHKDGRWIWVRNRAVRTYTHEGKLFADGVLIDVTRHKQAQAVNAQLASIVTSSIDAVIGKSAEGIIQSWNPAAEAMFGYSSDEAIGQSIAMLIPPDRKQEMIDVLGKIARFEPIERFDSVCLRKDGSCLDVSLAISPIVDSSGALLAISTIAHDVSLRKQAEQALRTSEQGLAIRNQIFNVFLTLPDDRMFAEVLGIVLKATESKHGLFGYIAEDGALAIPAMTSSGESSKVTSSRVRFPRESWGGLWGESLTEKRALYSNQPSAVFRGHIDIQRCLSAPILFKNRAIGLLLVANRATDYDDHAKELIERMARYMAAVLSARLQRDAQERARQRAEADLVKAKEVAEDANRAKTQFLANVSHELRTPMKGILGIADSALDTALTAEQREYLLTIKSSGDALLQLITELLDFTRSEFGNLRIEPMPFQLHETLRQTVRPLFAQAEQLGLQTSLELHPDLPDNIIGDPARLRQVLVDLLGNAVKFTHEGKIAVRAECQSQTERDLELLFTLTDTGIGIPADKQHLIFQPFRQNDGSITRRYGGTGLGLAVASRLVELMGGKIWLESEPGRGSTFYFTVCMGVPATPIPFSAN